MPVILRNVKTLKQMANFLQDCLVPSLLKSVEYTDTPDKTLVLTDNDDNVVLRILSKSGGYFRIYTSETSYYGFNGNAFPLETDTSTGLRQMIGCENGCIYHGVATDPSGYSRPFSFLLAKTNNGRIAVIVNNFGTGSDTSSQYENVNHIAFGDDTTFTSRTTFTPETGRQTMLNPFGTNPKLTESSVTPKAFYISRDTAYTLAMRTFTLNDEEFITNGYWAISTKVDEPAE